MKHNKRLKPASDSRIFSRLPFGKRRTNILGLSLLGITGVFITSIVLATSKPDNVSIQSQIIDLPNLPASIQIQQNPNKKSLTAARPILLEENTAPDAVQDNAEIAIDEMVTVETAALESQNLTLSSVDITDEPIIADELDWQEVTVKQGDNLSLIFPRVGLTARDVHQVAQLKAAIKPLLNLKPGQTLRFGFSSSEGDQKVLEKLLLQLNQVSYFELTAKADSFDANLVTLPVETRQAYATGTIENSLFEAGIEAGLSNKIVMELAHIFGWDIDFSLDLRKKDSFKLIYDEDYLDGKKIADGAILAAEFTNQGKTYRAIRFTDKAGLSRYYAPNGDSMRKTFSRSPVHFTRISSRFNPNRKHPVLKTSRPHRGVDYAAASGTPITATGDGKVDFVGRKGGYGRTIVLSHGGKYTTLYAHMSKFKRGIKRGKRVHQGDVIGYVGMSGLATGPHLHYEFRINGVHRNPVTVKLPKAEPLPKKYRSAFDNQAQPLLAQLDKVDDTAVALNK